MKETQGTYLKKHFAKVEKKGYEYNVGPEPEFFIIGEDGEGNIVPHDDGVYFDVEPVDQGTDVRRELVLGLEELHFDVEVSHHEVGPGQHEIDFKFDHAMKTADAVITFKQAIKAIVDNLGYMVTFMPKPFFGVNGSGMHVHQSLFKNGKNIFYDPDADKMNYPKKLSTLLEVYSTIPKHYQQLLHLQSTHTKD